MSVKGGSLESPPDLTGAAHNWVRRKLSGIVIPEGVACSAEEPPSP